MDSIILVLGNAAAWVSSHLLASAGIAAPILQIILSKIPSSKPLGIIHGMAALLRGASNLLSVIAQLIDALLPQNLK